ncbi:MAG: hypothetical protein DRJ43_05225 [Thermoprotei archaeon]|nr:MAG: hypothetical protein DRJ43_05225 [Thermoprotei archaeon]
MSWAKHHLEHLRRWREAVEAIAKAIRDLGIKAELYVIGGAAESRLTILSDIDVLLCLEEGLGPEDLWALRRKVLGVAMDKYGLPIDYPVELHIWDKKTCSKTLRREKAVRVKI